MSSYKDTTGYEVVFNDAPGRIVCLVPSLTELLFDIGLGSEIVGITDFCKYPATRVKAIPRTGPPLTTDVDAVRSLQPDLIIASAQENANDVILTLRKDFPVWVADVRTLSDALDTIRTLGEITDKSQNAHWLASQIDRRFKEFNAEWSMPRPVKVLYLSSVAPVTIAGENTIISNILEATGFKNIFLQSGVYSVNEISDIPVSPEVIIVPDFVPIHDNTLQRIRSAFPKARCYFADQLQMSGYGSRLLRTPNYLRELFSDIPK